LARASKGRFIREYEWHGRFAFLVRVGAALCVH
jgi:hypothetical protein